MSYNDYNSNSNDDYSSVCSIFLISYLPIELPSKLCGPIISAINNPSFLNVHHYVSQAFVADHLICRVAKEVSMTEPLARQATV